MIFKIAEILELSPDTIKDWAKNLGLNIENNKYNQNFNLEEFIDFFKKVRNFVASGYKILLIKDILSHEIRYLNDKLVNTATINDQQNQKEQVTLRGIFQKILNNDQQSFNEQIVNNVIIDSLGHEEKINNQTFNTNPNNYNYNAENIMGSINNASKEILSSANQVDIMILFDMMFKELRQYTERIINAEKKIFLLEDTEKRVKEDYYEVSSEIKYLKAVLEEKDKRLQDYEEQRKKLQLLETQLKLIQLNSKKKKFWEFWK